MATKNLNLGIVPVSRGEFNSTTMYYKDNIVQYKRGSYQVISESPIIGVPPTNDKNIVNPGWKLFAGTLDAQDVVNQIKEQEAKSIQAIADREAEILAKSDAAEVSFDNTGTSLSGTNVRDALEETDGKLSELGTKTSRFIKIVSMSTDGAYTDPSVMMESNHKYFIKVIPNSDSEITKIEGCVSQSVRPDTIFSGNLQMRAGKAYYFEYIPSVTTYYLRFFPTNANIARTISIYEDVDNLPSRTSAEIRDYANPITLEYKGSRADTRGQLGYNDRRKGTVISYVENEKLVVEKFTGTDVNDIYWKDPNDNNRLWYSVEQSHMFKAGVSVDLYSRGASIDALKIYGGKVQSIRIVQIVQAFAQNPNYYLTVIIDENEYYELVNSTGTKDYIICTNGGAIVVITATITTIATTNIFKEFTSSYIELKTKENIIPANTELCPSNIKNAESFSDNFEVGIYLACSRYGVSIQSYDGTSALKTTKMIPLYGGVKYTVNNVFNTDNIADFLYDANGNIIDAFSVKRQNASNVTSSIILYYIDLTNYKGIYYLRLSQKANSSGLSLITIKNQTEINFEDQDSISQEIFDSLINGKNDEVKVESGSYGNTGAVYSFPVKHSNYRISFNFKINKNVNSNGNDVQIAAFGGTAPNYIYAKCAAPSILHEAFGTDNDAYEQDLLFNSGFIVNGQTKTRVAKYSKPLVGEPAFYIWLKGASDFTKPTDEQLYDRQAWLANHNDYALSIENDALSIIRYNIGASSVTETLNTFSLKSGDGWKSLQTLFTEIQTALTDFSVMMGDLTSLKDCGDLLQFGVIPLVGYYNQKLRSTDEEAYCYDSYPVPVRFAIDETEHTCEIIQNNGYCITSIDGDTTVCIQTLPTKFIVGGEYVTVYNLRAKFNALGNDYYILGDSSHPRLVSDITPRLIGMMGHNIYDVSEETGVTNPGINNSVTRIEDICQMIKNKGYDTFSLDELIPIVQGNLKGVRKGVFIVYDDISIPTIWEDMSIHSKIGKYGVKMNSALIHTAIGDHASKIMPMRFIGWGCATHTIAHDVPVPRKNSRIAYWELHEIKNDCDTYCMTRDVLIYPYQGQWVNSYNMLKLCGYVCAINSGGDESWQHTTPYNLGRINMADSVGMDNILPYFV